MWRELLALVTGVIGIAGLVWLSVRTLADGDPLTLILTIAIVGLFVTATSSGRYDPDAAARRRAERLVARGPVQRGRRPDGRLPMPELPRDPR